MVTITDAALRFVSFVNASPTPFHAVWNAVNRLEKAGFAKLQETDTNWDAALKEGGRFYYTRNQSSLIAFTVPAGFKPGSGVSIVGTHTDSPNLRCPRNQVWDIFRLPASCMAVASGILGSTGIFPLQEESS